MSELPPPPSLSPPVVPWAGPPEPPPRHRLRFVLVAASALVVLAAAALGVDVAVTSSRSPTVNPPAARSMLDRTLAAAEAAGSFRYVSSSVSSTSGSSSLSQTTVGQAGATQGRQTITINGDTFDVLVVGDTAYLRGDADAMEAELQLPTSVAQAHAGQWISLVPGDAPYQSVYAAVTTMQAIDDNISFTPRVLLGSSTLGGIAVLGLRGPMRGTGGEPAKGTATLYVAASGRQLPVRYVEKGKVGSGSSTSSLDFTISFSSWGQPVSETVPPGAISYRSVASSGIGGRTPTIFT